MPDFRVFAPLNDFSWGGTSHVLVPGVEIIQRPQTPYPLRGLDGHLNRFDSNKLFFADHWLTVEWSPGEIPGPAEAVNLTLLSLWLAEPTKARVEFRFCVATDPAADPGSMTHLLDQFQWTPGGASTAVTDSNLADASSFYEPLCQITRDNSRLLNALALTLKGCMSVQWQPAFICYATAIEALLTFSRARGLTRKLSLAFACLLATASIDRDVHFRRFLSLYDKRSRIIHGSEGGIPHADRLPLLIEMGDALRLLWNNVLDDPAKISALESPDAARMTFFMKLKAEYRPPKR